MRVDLLIGPEERVAMRLRTVLREKSGALARHGIKVPGWNPVRLYLACADPDRHTALRFARGVRTPAAQARLRREIAAQLRGLADQGAERLVLACGQLGRLLCRPSEIARLRALLEPVADEVRITAHLDAPARMLARHYAERVLEGRTTPLDQELALARSGRDWWPAALEGGGPCRPYAGRYRALEAPPAWLDFEALRGAWEAGFGAGSVTFRGTDAARLDGEEAGAELAAALGLEDGLGRVAPAAPAAAPSAATLARARAMNPLLVLYAAKAGLYCPRDLRARLMARIAVPGAPIAAGSLGPVSDRFRAACERLCAEDPALAAALRPDPRAPVWREAAPGYGYRATQYLAAMLPALEKKGLRVAEIKAADAAEEAATSSAGGADGSALPALARLNVARLRNSPFAPHNRLGRVNEEELAEPFTAAPPRTLPEGTSGTVIVACMKNEAPYILEWIAHHRAIGVDHFLIYTNDSADTTAALLDRLDATGIVAHRRNDDWSGRSPQNHALARALDETLVRDAEWLIHIDVDEFINVRCGNGTLDDLRARVPGASNIAMTWRLFGHDGIARLEDRLVTEQFTACAPRFCPKPHTAWGYKTMFRNLGAYRRLSCHRPTKLRPERAPEVRWVNGSGEDITAEARDGGWRSSKTTIGYDLVQLNHYALRSADSFLVKRDRGRALHVDRQIGLNYWIRMDWSGARDITIQRNLPRLRAEYDRLRADPEIARLHAEGLAWHRDRAEALRGRPDFAALYDQALALKLDETERVAYALALDTES
ncbi:glycosyltransferase family 2 protein [Roseivivax sp. CAU 1761]